MQMYSYIIEFLIFKSISCMITDKKQSLFWVVDKTNTTYKGIREQKRERLFASFL